jgi:cytochrome c553
MRIPSSFLLAGVLATGASVRAAELAKAQVEFFENKIRPILAETCYKCHNAAEGKTKGGLTLDTRDATLKGGDSGPAVVPGNPDKSLLIKAISYKDPDLQMPPKGEKLTDQQIADLTAWVKMGAPDPRTGPANAKYKGGTDVARQHWAFQAPQKHEPPAVKKADWVKSPIDAFILAKQEAAGVQPSAPAPRATLIRRAYFALTGLPPTPQQVQDFEQDSSPDAFAKIVDQLLASPQFGERWGRYWLDVARYSDTKGNAPRREDGRFPYAWTYRDYVIKSFNEDKPYDVFIREQIAADKIPGASRESLAALGFLTLGDRFDGNMNDVINDRIDVVTKGFLALTVACARCHDHMFDPIPTKDYYSLHGVFASSPEPKEKPLLEDIKKDAEYQDYVAKRDALIRNLHVQMDKQINGLLSDFRTKAGAYLLSMKLNGTKLTELTRSAKLDRNTRQFIQGPLRRARANDPVLGPWVKFAALPEKDFAAKAKQVCAEIAANKDKKNPVNPHVAAMFKTITPQSLGQVAGYYTALFSRVDAQWNAILKTGRVPGGLADPWLEQIRVTPVKFTTAASLEIDELMARLPNNLQGRLGQLTGELNRHEMTHPGAPARAMVLADAPQPRNSPVFIRGEPGNRGEPVPRQFLEILSGPNRKPFTSGSGRYELAYAVSSKGNPLTARVMVNRVWLHLFGEGFVNTPDDFGTMAEKPSHPELLDWLAIRFMDQGWSVKKLIREIMLTSTYQQTSDTNPRYAQIDPNNRLLWRANIRKLEFEALRDSLLAIGGKLDLTVGGKPVNITTEPYSNRRSVYGYIDRNNVPEVMTHFDFATPDMPTGKRYDTIVPQQALFLMNSPQVIEVTRNLMARKEITAARTPEAKVEALYQVIYQRKPRPEELKLGLEFIKGAPVVTAAPSAAVTPVATAPAGKAAKKAIAAKTAKGKMAEPQNKGRTVDRRPLAAWEEYAQALLLANEASYVN